MITQHIETRKAHFHRPRAGDSSRPGRHAFTWGAADEVEGVDGDDPAPAIRTGIEVATFFFLFLLVGAAAIVALAPAAIWFGFERIFGFGRENVS